jgi:hypothetical protein
VPRGKEKTATECGGLLVSTPASYWSGPGFVCSKSSQSAVSSPVVVL